MPTLPVPFSEIRELVAVWHQALDAGYEWTGASGGARSALREAADQLGWEGSNASRRVKERLRIAVALGLEVRHGPVVSGEEVDNHRRRYRAYDEEFRQAEANLIRPVARRKGGKAASPAVAPVAPPPVDIVAELRRRGGALADMAARLSLSPGATLDALLAAQAAGAAVTERGGVWQLDAAPALGSSRSDVPELVTDAAGRLTFGAIGDTHLCSKYARLDCLGDWYDQAAARGIRTVLHAGNWIDGEAEFNRHDLLVHGMDAQMQYLAEHYPRRDGVETWAITGADHEGWYARREGVDVGRYADRVMRDAGRSDWRDLGYMEAVVRVRHPVTGVSSNVCVMHPGGGSAYAISYAPQKIVEGFDGGDKPAVLLIGHYHKASYQLTRNVHTIQVGCFQDQTVFMRQKKLSGHLAGCFVSLEMDQQTGAIISCATEFRNYFVREYYNGRWSQHGPVVQTPRKAA